MGDRVEEINSTNHLNRRVLYVSPFDQYGFVFLPSLLLRSYSRSLWRGLLAAQANTSLGTGALQNNTTGSYNTAIGLDALFSNTTGSYNTATGVNALFRTPRATSTPPAESMRSLATPRATTNTASGVQCAL